MDYTGDGIAGMLGKVEKMSDVYTNNPTALKNKAKEQANKLGMGNIAPATLELLALQKITSEKEAAQRDLQLKMQQDPSSVADQLERKATQLTMNELTGQVGDTLKTKQAKQQRRQAAAPQAMRPPAQMQRPPMPMQRLPMQQGMRPQGAGIMGAAPQQRPPMTAMQRLARQNPKMRSMAQQGLVNIGQRPPMQRPPMPMQRPPMMASGGIIGFQKGDEVKNPDRVTPYKEDNIFVKAAKAVGDWAMENPADAALVGLMFVPGLGWAASTVGRYGVAAARSGINALKSAKNIDYAKKSAELVKKSKDLGQKAFTSPVKTAGPKGERGIMGTSTQQNIGRAGPYTTTQAAPRVYSPLKTTGILSVPAGGSLLMGSEEPMVQEPVVGNQNQKAPQSREEPENIFKFDNDAAKEDNAKPPQEYSQDQLLLALSKLKEQENPDQELINQIETLIREGFARGGIIGFQAGDKVEDKNKIEFETTPNVGSDNYDMAVKLLQQAGALDDKGNLLTKPDMTSPKEARENALKNLLEGERKTLGERQKKELQDFYGQVSPDQLKKEQDSAFLRNIGGGVLGLRDASTARAKVKDAQRKEQERQILGLQGLERETLKDRIDIRKSAEDVFKNAQTNMKDLMTTSITTLATMSAEDRKAAEAIIDRDFNLLKLNVEAALTRAKTEATTAIEKSRIIASLSNTIATVTASVEKSYGELDLALGADEEARARNKERKDKVLALLTVPLIEQMAALGGDTSLYTKSDSGKKGESKKINVGDLSDAISDLLGG
jgi:hypothetical protein